MKRIVTIVVLICAVVFQMNAQVTVEHALKEAEQTKRFRYALPMITLSGKKYVIVQTADWNMEHPLVGWQLQNYMRTDEEREAFKGDARIWFLIPAAYNNILAKYREYKATNK